MAQDSSGKSTNTCQNIIALMRQKLVPYLIDELDAARVDAEFEEAAQGAEEAQDTGEAQGDSFPRKYSTKFFHRDGQPNTYIGSFRWKVFQTFENPGFSNLAKLISIVVMATILVSTLTFVFESEACEPTSFVPAKSLKAFLVIEIVSVTIFTMCAPGARVGLRAKAEAHSMWRAA